MATRESAALEVAHPPRWLLVVGAVAGAILCAAFLIAGLATTLVAHAPTDNWLIILLNLNLRPDSTQASALSGVSPLDIALILMLGLVLAAMFPALGSASRAWAVIVVALPFLGVLIFLATATAGRSAALLAGLIASILALRARFGRPVAAIAGIVASALLLFIGDFGTAALAPSVILAVAIGIGYALWTAWLLLVTVELIRRARIAAA